MDDPFVWSVEPQGRMTTLSEAKRLKLHINRGDSTALCSRRVFLNALDTTSPIGFGGGLTADAPSGRLSEYTDDVCARCRTIYASSSSASQG